MRRRAGAVVADNRRGNDSRPAADRARPIPILINREGGAAAGDDGLAAKVETACRDIGLAAEVRLLAAGEIAVAVEAHADRDRIVIGGGDGTVQSAAAALIRLGSDAALGILPLGTRNHLARQLAIPLDIAGAMALLAQSDVRRIDVGQVNDHIFLNNASIGMYPELVRSRDEEERRHHIPKWIANILAARAVLRRLRHHRLQVEAHGRAQVIRTPLLFVGNNVYSLEAGHIGQRAALDAGKLSLFALATHSRLSVLWFALRTLVGRADPEQDFAALETSRELIVRAHAATIQIALDGELRWLQTPLRFASLAGAVRVIAPRSATTAERTQGP
jgi:diacylglycerol kinase family enzyme